MKLSRNLITVVSSLSVVSLIGVMADRMSDQQARIEEMSESSRIKSRAQEMDIVVPAQIHESVGGEKVLVGPSARGTELVFFSTGCTHCAADAWNWDEQTALLAERGVKMIAVARGPERLEEFVAHHELELPVIVDSDGSLADLVGITAVPSRVFLTPRGRVRLRDEGVTQLRHRGAGVTAAWEGYSAPLRESLALGFAREFDVRVESVHEMQLVAGQDPVLVFEGEGGLRGFGALVSRPVTMPLSSNLECFLWLDTAGEVRGVVPLVRHVQVGEKVGAAELLAWCGPKPLVHSDEPLKQALVAEVEELRSQFDLAPNATGLVVTRR